MRKLLQAVHVRDVVSGSLLLVICLTLAMMACGRGYLILQACLLLGYLLFFAATVIGGIVLIERRPGKGSETGEGILWLSCGLLLFFRRAWDEPIGFVPSIFLSVIDSPAFSEHSRL